ncbi:unnamed protein product [Prorocentrum cordatum]|uniref:Uncharacterized protein n=1 Tax=Prorocentrum cordatum TaxID=2364126 RepID=A0ABN9RKQ7_9DINO|nr:unnamed protein product [Polarella glacialis]
MYPAMQVEGRSLYSFPSTQAGFPLAPAAGPRAQAPVPARSCPPPPAGLWQLPVLSWARPSLQEEHSKFVKKESGDDYSMISRYDLVVMAILHFSSLRQTQVVRQRSAASLLD